MMTVETKIDCYEKNGTDCKKVGDRPQLIILSHWSMTDRITIKASDGGDSFTVIATDLIKAIQNAQNHR